MARSETAGIMPQYLFPSSMVSQFRTGCITRPAEKSVRAFSIARIKSSQLSAVRTSASSKYMTMVTRPRQSIATRICEMTLDPGYCCFRLKAISVLVNSKAALH